MAVERGHGSRSASAASRRAVDLPPASRSRRSGGRGPAPRRRASANASATRGVIGAPRGRRSGRAPPTSRRRPRRGLAFGRACEQQGAVGQEAAAADLDAAPDRLEAEAAGAALIGERAVDEAVAEHPVARRRAPAGWSCATWSARAAAKSRASASGRPAIVVAVEQQAADRLGAGASAGLAGRRPRSRPRAAQRLGQRLQLGRLADALPALEA